MSSDFPMRLQLYLARSGYGSRRFCETLITEGRVRVNTVKVTTLGTKVEQDDVVTVDHQLAEVSDQKFYYALNKPRGYVSSNYDPNETAFARDLIDVPHQHYLFHVGRLDKDSSGLILFTNDGEAAQIITHPKYEIEKEYYVTTKEIIQRAHLEEALKGVYIDSQRPYTIRRFALEGKRQVRITLTEGKNREIRKILDHYGYTVQKLIRLRIGSLLLKNLQPGRYRAVSKGEIARLLKEAQHG